VLLLAVLGLRLLGGGSSYTAELPDAAGIRSGDEVRVAGIVVGKVQGIAAVGDRVRVRFTLHKDVPLTRDTRDEVKVASLLGQRFLNLEPGDGPRIGHGATLPLANARGTYTLEKFWVENSDVIGDLDLKKLSTAVTVLTNDLSGDPQTTRDALDGMSAVASMITKRDAQLTQLLSLTKNVTHQAVAQRDQLVTLIGNADKVFTMIEQRKQAVSDLLASTRNIIVTLTAMAKRNAKPMHAALTQLKSILRVLTAQRDNLAKTLQTAEPALRFYVNSAGDGPWLGVNAPYLILPDSLWCLELKGAGCS
jgi:phospholipid/cholesterol/gamma-HCH transport system substrate-binding protein